MVSRTRSLITTGAIPAGGRSATVPAGKRWLVKAVSAFNASGATRTFNVNVTPVGGAAATLLTLTVANNTGDQRLCYLVLEAGEVLTISTAVTGPIVQASGIQFDA